MILKRSPQGQGAPLPELLKVRQGCTDALILGEQPPSHPILIHIQSAQSMSVQVEFWCILYCTYAKASLPFGMGKSRREGYITYLMIMIETAKGPRTPSTDIAYFYDGIGCCCFFDWGMAKFLRLSICLVNCKWMWTQCVSFTEALLHHWFEMQEQCVLDLVVDAGILFPWFRMSKISFTIWTSSFQPCPKMPLSSCLLTFDLR